MNEISVNRRAYFDYQILETYEAGIELFGFEVKAITSGRVSIVGSFVVIQNEIPVLLNANIPPYQSKNAPKSYEPTRSRRLLLHKAEINELLGAASQKGLTIVPLKIYNKGRRIKLLIGLARHKKAGDKREIIKKRDTEREIRRTLGR